MRKAIKAALFSALVFPGVGHFSLKRYQRGLIFFIPATLCLLFLVREAIDKAYAIAEQIEQGNVPLDTLAISNLISTSPDGTDLLMLNIATWVLLASWLASIIDSYRLGKIADQTHRE